jgi:hypothetical protein
LCVGGPSFPTPTPFFDQQAFFDQQGPAQLLCAQQVWEALLAAFPLKHKRMQTVLLAREIGRLMAWDGDSKIAVNTHFGKVGDIRRAFEYMGALTIDDVFRSVILATLKSSNNNALRTAYDQILDDLDDNKDLTFAHIQTVCARQFRCTKERHPDPPHRVDTQRPTPRTTLVKTEQYNKYKRQRGNELAAFLCNTLEKHGEQPGNVLHRAGLTGAEWNEPASVTALFMAAQKHFPCSVPSDTDDDDDTDYDAAAVYELDD